MPSAQQHTKSTDGYSAPIRASLVKLFIFILGWLPWRLAPMLGQWLASLLVVTKARMYTTSLSNLSLCMPELSETQKRAIAKQSLSNTLQHFFETAMHWTRPKQNYHESYNVINQELVQQAQARDKGVVLALLHMGNWEVGLSKLALNGSILSNHLYRPLKIKELEEYVHLKRNTVGKWNLHPANLRTVKTFLALLQQGAIVSMLPDQEPVLSGGRFAPFFGHPALTSTLLPKLIQKTDASLVFVCIHQKNGQNNIEFIEPNIEFNHDIDTALSQLNSEIEKIVRRYPEQYSWSYKRFKTQPDGRELYVK